MDNNEIKNLPTIIELIDKLSFSMLDALQDYEHIHPAFASIFGFSPEGGYVMRNREGKRVLLPSGFRGLFFRGQNQYYEPCIPSIHRIKDKNILFLERLKRSEFMELLATHPIIADMEDKGYYIDKMALAQHYGFWTNLLDLSSDIWLAAFMATTKYNPESDSYSPVDEKTYKKGYGVLYVSKGYTDNHPRITELGYNFFPRPFKQMASTYSMQESDDFNNDDFFDKHLFRHDGIVSQRIFEMAFQQRKYWPQDILADKANEIKRFKKISEKVFEAIISSEGLSSGQALSICESNGYTITKVPNVRFNEQEIKIAMEQERKMNKRKILPFMLNLNK